MHGEPPLPAPAPPGRPSLRRRLTEIEYVNWCFGQPYNMAVAVRLRGVPDAAPVLAAVERLQRRHPLLAVTTVVGPDGVPWLDSSGVGPVPVRVVGNAGPDDGARLLESDVHRPFALDLPPLPTQPPGAGATGQAREPLLRVSVLLPADPGDPTEVVLCAQHVIADGLSMFFLVRDLLAALRDPASALPVLDAAAGCERVLPPAAARRMHRTPAAALLARTGLRALHAVRSRLPRRRDRTPGLTLGDAARSPAGTDRVPPLHSWQLTAEQTRALLDRCHRERVSVQSALCTAFLPAYTAINTPVSLRGVLAVDVGESVGLFVGNAVVLGRYRAGHDFWTNARAFHRRLRRAMRDPFLMIRMCSPAVPRPVVHEVMTELMELVGSRRPLAVTNLGVLDGAGLSLDDGCGPRIESFHGAMSGFASASVLTAYTIDGSLRLHLRGQPVMSTADTIAEASAATALLLGALDPPGTLHAPGEPGAANG